MYFFSPSFGDFQISLAFSLSVHLLFCQKSPLRFFLPRRPLVGLTVDNLFTYSNVPLKTRTTIFQDFEVIILSLSLSALAYFRTFILLLYLYTRVSIYMCALFATRQRQRIFAAVHCGQSGHVTCHQSFSLCSAEPLMTNDEMIKATGSGCADGRHLYEAEFLLTATCYTSVDRRRILYGNIRVAMQSADTTETDVTFQSYHISAINTLPNEEMQYLAAHKSCQ